MKSKVILVIFFLFFPLFFAGPCTAGLDWAVYQELDPGGTPIDVAVSRTGKWIFILTDAGKVKIFSTNGTLKETFDAGPETDGIEAGVRDDLLYISSRKTGKVRLVVLDFILDIDTAGSPFKGPADAPVVIVVFSDFQ